VATFDAAVRQAVEAEQQDLIDHSEHCSADPEALAGIGRALGHQVRVRPDADQSVFALYTVSQTRDEAPDAIVRMGRGGRERLGAGETFAAVVDSVVPRPGLSDDDAQRLHEFVERLSDNGTHRGLIAIAPHGGDIERHTDTQAERVAERLAEYGVSAWRCKGFGPDGGGASRLLHITSTDIHEASFPALGSVIGRGFRYAVAFHGFREEEVLVGGAAPFRLRAEIACAIENALSGSGIQVRIAGPDDVSGGDSPRNIVNRLTASKRGGVHIEQSLQARTDHALDIANAVAEVFAGRLGRPRYRGPRWSRLRCWLRHTIRDWRRRRSGSQAAVGRRGPESTGR
jgi:phage replication-related protein YjqB (UPF0714/DUF867 family)